MAQVYTFLDQRSTRNDGTCPIKIAISHKRQTVTISTGLHIAPEYWDASKSKVTNHPLQANYQSIISTKVLQCEKVILQLMDSEEIAGMSAKDIKYRIEGKKKTPSNNFLQHFNYVASMKSESTQNIYKNTLYHLRKFEPKLEKLTFEDITKDWLTRFDRHMALTSPSANARNIHLRNIRTVINNAIDNQLTTFYAFRTYRIKPAPTAKRSVVVDRLREFMTTPCDSYLEYYRDMFMLSFLLIGINMKDMIYLTSIKDGRVDYVRFKTKKPYSIKVEPEALEIINRYRGEKYLLNIADKYTNYRNFTHRINNNIKKIGATYTREGLGGKKIYSSTPFADFTTYWARHTWATIAASLDVPMETISAALGHEIGNPTTAIYINFYQEKVDIANRKVIDWVYYGKRD